MKKAFNSVPFSKIALFFIGILTFSLSSCSDKDNDVVPEPEPQSIVAFYHGSPDAPDLDILIKSLKINRDPFRYSDYSNYLAFIPGSVRVQFAPVNSASAVIDTTLTFKDDKIYSLFVVDKLQQIDLLVVQDSLVSPAAGKARLRFIHLSPDASAVDLELASTGTTPTNLFSNVAFKGVTEFQDIAAGTLTLQVKGAGSSNVLKSASNINLQAGRIYTFVFRGFVTPPANNTKGLDLQLLPAGS